jgi:hypothetical protein
MALIEGINGDFPRDTYRDQSTQFLDFAVNELEGILTRLTGEKCSVSIKLLVPGPESQDTTPYVRTFFRDKQSFSARDQLYAELEPFSINQNSMMEDLLNSEPTLWWKIENDLARVAGYRNRRTDFARFFNASAIYLIGDPNQQDNSSVVGFLCVDNPTNGFDYATTPALLSIFASTVFYCLFGSAALELEETNQTERS